MYYFCATFIFPLLFPLSSFTLPLYFLSLSAVTLTLSLVHFSPSLPCSGSLSLALFLLLFVVLSRRGAAVTLSRPQLSKTRCPISRWFRLVCTRGWFRYVLLISALFPTFTRCCWCSSAEFSSVHRAAYFLRVFFSFDLFFFSCVWFFSLLGGFGSFWWGFFWEQPRNWFFGRSRPEFEPEL